MKPRSHSALRLSVLVLMALFPAVTLHAQATRIFVASFGNDSNDGSRGSPKRNFQAAHDAVAAGGQIVALDTAGYGKLNITKSISVTVPPGVNGFITATGISDTAVRMADAPSGVVVSLRGLILEGGGTGSGSNRGVTLNGGTLYLDDCIIRNFGSGVEAGFTDNHTVAVVARNVQVRNCAVGFFINADTNASVASVLTDCLFDGCTQYGVLAQSAVNAYHRMTLTRCTATGNPIGIQSVGQATTVYIDTCTLSNNGTGVKTTGSGQLLSRGNNTFTNNSADGAFTGSLATK